MVVSGYQFEDFDDGIVFLVFEGVASEGLEDGGSVFFAYLVVSVGLGEMTESFVRDWRDAEIRDVAWAYAADHGVEFTALGVGDVDAGSVARIFSKVAIYRGEVSLDFQPGDVDRFVHHQVRDFAPKIKRMLPSLQQAGKYWSCLDNCFWMVSVRSKAEKHARHILFERFPRKIYPMIDTDLMVAMVNGSLDFM